MAIWHSYDNKGCNVVQLLLIAYALSKMGKTIIIFLLSDTYLFICYLRTAREPLTSLSTSMVAVDILWWHLCCTHNTQVCVDMIQYNSMTWYRVIFWQFCWLFPWHNINALYWKLVCSITVPITPNYRKLHHAILYFRWRWWLTVIVVWGINVCLDESDRLSPAAFTVVTRDVNEASLHVSVR